MGYIKKLKNNELVGGTDKTTIYPVTSTEAVFEEITNGNESSFKSQKNINKEHNTTLNNHEERLQTAEAEDVKSITINGSTKKFEVDDKNNVDLTLYTVDSDPDMPGIADNVRDLRNMVGTSTPVLETSHKTRIETLEGGESITGSVENKIKTKIDSINSSYQDDNNEYVKYSMTQTSGKITDFNIDETSLKNAITSLNTSISGDNIVIRSGSTPSGTGEAGKIYRYVNSSNNTYTDYMYSGGSWVTLATHDTSNEQAQVAYYTCTATGSGAQATKQFVGNGSLTYTPSSGGHIKILMGEANTATGTIYLQFGTTTSTKKPLYYNGESVSSDNTWEAGETIAVYYDPSANNNAGAYFASNAQGGGGKAKKIKYDNSGSGLTLENVQGALDETAFRIGVNERSSFSYIDNKFISTEGVITDGNGYEYTTPIFLFAGDKITVKTASYLLATISLYENGIYTPIYAPTEGDTTTIKTYEYTATENCFVVASVKKSPTPSVEIESDVFPLNKAKGIQYDNSKSLLGAENVQDAIDKVVTNIQEETPYNVDDYPTQKAGLGESTWFWNKNNQRGKHKVIPVTSGDVLHVTSQAVGTDLGAWSGWLTSSYTPPTTDGGDIPYVTGTTRFVTNDSVITAPEGAAWLCLTVIDGAGNTIINTVAKVTKLKDIVNETQDKFGDLSGDDIAKNLERTTGHYISLQGEEQEAQGYFVTAPIHISAGTKLSVTYKGGFISVVSKVDGDTYVPILTDENHTGPTELTKHIVIEDDGFYVFCSSSAYGINAVLDLTVSERIGVLERDTIGENVKYTYKGTGQYIDSNLDIIEQSFEAPIYVITNEIEVKKGETITVKTKGGQIYVIVEYSEGEIVRGLLFSDSAVAINYNEYSYTADKDMFVLVGGVNDSTNPLTVTIGQNFTNKINNLTQYHCGIYLYPFRAIVNKPVSIYRESVVSGLRPLYNYTVQTNFTQHDPTDDYSKYTIRFKATSEGTTPLTIIATDEFNNHISKTVNVISRTMPESKLSNVNNMDVMFLGDSMIGWNANLVGAEWRRMLATNDSETHVDPVTKAMQIPTYNVCPNKLNLVGEQMSPQLGARFCYVNRIQQILTGTRTDDYNPNIGPNMNGNKNPFYNRNSSEPNTIDEDGFNRRVDFNWYFDNACGVGGYPKLFYIALGANDIYQTWNWSFDGVKPTMELLLKVIKRIKSVCDERAGGDSGIKIKVFNHQTYPLYNMYGYEFPILQQRLVWNALYDSYYEAITNPSYGISEYTEFVDCGSKFDWRVGYTTEDISTNVRYDGNQDVYMEQTCHMNNVGAYNYADCLIDDFLVDSDFD